MGAETIPSVFTNLPILQPPGQGSKGETYEDDMTQNMKGQEEIHIYYIAKLC